MALLCFASLCCAGVASLCSALLYVTLLSCLAVLCCSLLRVVCCALLFVTLRCLALLCCTLLRFAWPCFAVCCFAFLLGCALLSYLAALPENPGKLILILSESRQALLRFVPLCFAVRYLDLLGFALLYVALLFYLAVLCCKLLRFSCCALLLCVRPSAY